MMMFKDKHAEQHAKKQGTTYRIHVLPLLKLLASVPAGKHVAVSV